MRLSDLDPRRTATDATTPKAGVDHTAMSAESVSGKSLRKQQKVETLGHNGRCALRLRGNYEYSVKVVTFQMDLQPEAMFMEMWSQAQPLTTSLLTQMPRQETCPFLLEQGEQPHQRHRLHRHRDHPVNLDDTTHPRAEPMMDCNDVPASNDQVTHTQTTQEASTKNLKCWKSMTTPWGLSLGHLTALMRQVDVSAFRPRRTRTCTSSRNPSVRLT